MRELLNDLFYKEIDFTITIYDPVGEYENGKYYPKDVHFAIKPKAVGDSLFKIECVYDNFILLKYSYCLKWSFHTICFKDIKSINWTEPIEEGILNSNTEEAEDIPF